MAKSTVLVVGGGTMGRGIAGLCALSGFGTAIFEADPAGRGRLRAAIEDSWERAARRGKVSAESVEAAPGLLRILERLDEGKERFRPPEILRRLVAKGRTGRKSGRGFYRWVGETAVEALAPESDEP